MLDQRIQRFKEIVEDNKVSIYRICRIYAVAPLELEDLFQEVVFQVWKSYSTYNGKAEIGTWIYRIALNVCMRFKLRLEKQNTLTAELTTNGIVFSDTSGDDDQEERFIALRSCIRTLKETDQSLVILYLEGLAYKEISDITGLTENHIAVKMKRIRKILLDCITPKIKGI